MARKEIRIAGFGGQGIVLSGSIIGKGASIYDNGYAAMTQSYGPESRGGSCRTEVVVSDAPIEYPYLVNPNIQIVLSQEAYNEFGKNAPKDSILIVDADLVKVDPAQKTRILSIHADQMAQDLGRPVVANIIMMGFLAASSDIVSAEALKKAVLDSVPPGTEELNKKAFELGYTYGVEQSSKNKR